MVIKVNGQDMTIESLSVLELITEKGLHPELVAVEYNGEVLPRKNWGNTQLADGDRIELIHFVGGG